MTILILIKVSKVMYLETLTEMIILFVITPSIKEGKHFKIFMLQTHFYIY